jgi:hypothetical protein
MLQQLALHGRRVSMWSKIVVLATMGVVPAVMSTVVSAAPTVTERELQSTSAVAAGSTALTWVFDTTSDVANIDHIEIEFCDSPLSTCSAPNGGSNAGSDNIPILPASPTATLTNFTSGGNSATRVGGDGGGTANQILIDKTTADAGASLDEATIAISGFTNDETSNRSYYTRLRVYSDTGTTLVWEGVFAQSTSQTLTVNARVQERLDFCVGSTTVDDATTSVGAACANITGTNVDIGNVESGFTNVSPVDATNGGDDENGVAMIRTNAVNGAVVDYKSILNSSSGTLKVTGATCNAVPSTSGTDQCFNTSTTQGAFTAGTEAFGMTVAGINCGSTTAYSCVFGSGTYNLVRDAAYDGNGANTYVADNNQVSGTTTAGYTWDATAAADRIASSAGSAVKVIDDEAMILKFAATSGITTPTGAYTVQADFIATATF